MGKWRDRLKKSAAIAAHKTPTFGYPDPLDVPVMIPSNPTGPLVEHTPEEIEKMLDLLLGEGGDVEDLAPREYSLKKHFKELKAIASSATHGKWSWHDYGKSGRTLAVPNGEAHELNILKTTDDWPPNKLDEVFIETFDPAMVLRLLNRIEKLEKKVKK